MYTFNAIISYILPNHYNFFSAVIISIDNQADNNIKMTVLNKNWVLLSFKHTKASQ